MQMHPVATLPYQTSLACWRVVGSQLPCQPFPCIYLQWLLDEKAKVCFLPFLFSADTDGMSDPRTRATGRRFLSLAPPINTLPCQPPETISPVASAFIHYIPLRSPGTDEGVCNRCLLSPPRFSIRWRVFSPFYR